MPDPLVPLRRDLTTFTDVTAPSGIVHREYGMGDCAGDVDGDGRTDLYVTNYEPDVLYRNAGNGAFTDITRRARVGLDGLSTSCAFLDVDRDGDLDLFIANYLDAPPGKNPFSEPVVPRPCSGRP